MTTPFMSIDLPVPVGQPGATSGPAWADKLNTALGILDTHTHETGYGAPVKVKAAGGLVARLLSDWVRALDPGWVNVRDPQFAGGAKGDGTTDDTAAFTAALAAVGGNKPGTLYVPAGTYKTDTLSLPAWCSIVGDGWLNTTLRPLNNNNSLIKLDRAVSSSWGYQNEIRGLHLWGYATGTGHGIYGTGVYVSAIGPSGLRIRDVYIDGLGGDGLHLDEAWNTKLESVQSSNNLGHQFFIDSAINTVLFDTCYAKGIPTAGKAGFRIVEGQATFLNCNGIDTGDYWGVFGGEVADGDDRAANTFIQVTGGNIESAAVRGLWLKRNSLMVVDGNTKFVANANGTSSAITTHNFNNNNPVTIGAAVSFVGTWANGFPLHAWTTPGFLKDGIGTGSNSWSDQFSVSSVVPARYAMDGEGVVRLNGGVVLGTSASAEKLKGAVVGTATWDPALIADGAMTSTTVTVTGAVLGDVAMASFTLAVPAGALLMASVTATDTVTVTLFNKTGGNLDLGSGTLRAVVWKH